MPRQKNPRPIFDSSKIKKGHKVIVDRTFGLSGQIDFVATVVEPTSKTDVLEGVPLNRQMVVRPDGKRKSTVIDKSWVVRKV